ncbi:MAG: CHASE3 domain-containing protein [Leptospiraceae bacterium]|nr:CHASE3 domain-containing protein [Leptospiraceae bacterium]
MIKLKIGGRVLIGYIIVLALIIIIGCIVFFNLKTINGNFHWVIHTDEVLRNAERLKKLVVDMETGERGFMITGKDEFLEPYNQGWDDFAKLIAAQKNLVSDNPPQVKRLEEIEKNVYQWKNIIAIPLIAKRREVTQQKIDYQEIINIISKAEGKKIMDTIRGQFDEFTNIEIQLMTKREKDTNSVISSMEILITALTLAAIIVGVIIALLITRSITKPLSGLLNTLNSIEQKGDFSTKIDIQSQDEVGQVGNALNSMMAVFQDMNSDVIKLANSAIAGQLSTRADTSKYQGDFKRIISGINNTLDTVVLPIQEASNVLQQLKEGNLNVMVKGNYSGDHAIIKENLNDTILSLKNYIGEISTILVKMAEGNLNIEVTGDYKGDFINIKKALNNIIDSFNLILNQIANGSNEVLASANQLSTASQSLSDGANEQTSSVEEIVTSLAEVGAQVKQTAENANTTNGVMVVTRQKAIAGNNEMKALLNAIEDLNNTSEKISKIIREIESIAFQTNILALNAGVEAARAGHYGKGFNVVATEVRNLAMRASASAKETSELIEETIKKINSSSKLTGNTADILNDMMGNINQVTELVGQIAVAANEQNSAVTNVSNSIDHIAKITMSNSAASEQMAASSEELTGQAESFRQMSNQFELKKLHYSQK